MIAFPKAKINLGLAVVSKRADGFHNIETIFYPLKLRDALEIIPDQITSLNVTGLQVPGDIKKNLVFLALQKMRTLYPQIGDQRIFLHKIIPMGAGLGGGSSDAASVLDILNQFYQLNLPNHTVSQIAAELGSDCAFFLQNSPCFATGRGEILEPLALDLSPYSILLIHSKILVDTSWAYSKIKPAVPAYQLKESVLKPVESWRDSIKNDFEIPVFEAYPGLMLIKDQLYKNGAVYASMTGSGSTIFGIFPKNKIPEISFENAAMHVLN